MRRFSITLLDNREAEVRWRKLRKPTFKLIRIFRPKTMDEGQVVYTITVLNGRKQKEVYRLYKSEEGRWSQDAEGKKELGGGIRLSIRNAIAEWEAGY